MLPYDRDLYLLVDDGKAEEVVYDLSMIGLDRIEGIVGTDAVDHWKQSGGKLGTITQMSPEEVAPLLARDDLTVIDVRSESEWEEGHLPNVSNIPAGYIADHLDELPTDSPLVLHCRSGARSSIAASVLAARGFTNVVNMSGGYIAWQQAGLPVEKATEPELQASA
jgi:hydroxyacylglutathione hydrolase